MGLWRDFHPLSRSLPDGTISRHDSAEWLELGYSMVDYILLAGAGLSAYL